MPLRVLHLITTLDRGGAEKALLAACRGLAARGVRSSVAYLKGPGELRPDFEAAGADVTDLAIHGIRAPRSIARAARLVRDAAPDVVHSHLFKADVLAAAIAGRREARHGAALVSTKHNVDMHLTNPLWRRVGRSAACRADALIAVSDGVKSFLQETLRDLPAKIDVVRYGVEPSARPLTAPPGTGVFLCAARFDAQKDHDTLLDAFGRVVSADAGRRARLVLLGRGSLEDNIRQRAARLPAGSVEFAGFAADPVPRFDAADAVVLSSRWEGLGLALVEAALRERPAVATRTGGIPEVVEDGATGLLVPPRDPAALADAMLRIVSDPKLARRMGTAARTLCERRFDAASSCDALLAVYERVRIR